jgi:uncharacterized protein (DUF2141 family)
MTALNPLRPEKLYPWKETIMRALTFALFLLPLTPAVASAGDLTVTISDIKNDTGSVLAAVYDSEASFLKPPLARVSVKFKAEQGKVTFALPGLPPGKYAISAYHDENDNGKLDRNAFGVPTEGFGFSNDAHGTGGPPAFAAAAVTVADGSKAIKIDLDY